MTTEGKFLCLRQTKYALTGETLSTVGGFKITPAGVVEIGRRIAALRRDEGPLPTVIIQEGGYLLSELGELVVRFLKAFE